MVRRHLIITCLLSIVVSTSSLSLQASERTPRETKAKSIDYQLPSEQKYATKDTQEQEPLPTPSPGTPNATTIVYEQDEDDNEADAETRAKNRRFDNVLVNQYLDAQNLRISENAIISGNLTARGNTTVGNNLTVLGDTVIAGDTTFTGTITAAGDFTITGTLTVDDIVLNTITKNNITIAWPATAGAAGSFIGNDGAGNLVYATPAGGGNVSTAAFFTNDNRLVTTDLPSSVTNIKQAGVTLDGSNNISGVNALSATTVNGTLNGNVGSKTTAAVVSATQIVENATNTLTPNTLVLRDASNNFSAGTITANLIGNITGSAGTAGSATTAGTATNFSGSLTGDVSGTQGATQVDKVGGSTASAINTATILANQATDANTGGRIVRRDGAGNFAAGTITAAQFSGPLSGNVTGNVTGDLFGTADYATYATTSTNFTGVLAGDVTGSQSSTSVALVNGQTAATISAGALLANAATENDMANRIVKRDGSGNFATNMITINGDVNTSPKNVTTKEYVDQMVATGFVVKEPVLVVSLVPTLTSGTTESIDGVTPAPNDRILLINEDNDIYNGIWLAQSGNWTRPSDFLNGTQPGQAYVLTMTGLTQSGSSWVCNTPTALIGTDTLTFAQFSVQGRTTGANVGTGVGIGQIFRDKTGIFINFKSLAPASNNFLTIANGTDQLTLSITATSDSTANTLVARDANNDFSAGTITASLAGSASNNVLKAGDTMSGTLSMTTGNAIHWHDSTSGNYVGLNAPTTVGTNYTIALPASAPVAGQYLHATAANTTDWQNIDAPPTVNKTYFVSLAGSDNDTSNDGSLSLPYRTIKHALDKAKDVASSTNPVAISIGAGIFEEDNSAGPLSIEANGINIIGESLLATIITTSVASEHLFTSAVTDIELCQATLQAKPGSDHSAFVLTADALGKYCFKDLLTTGFNTGFEISSSTALSPVFFINGRFTNNGTGIFVTNAIVEINSSYIAGSSTNVPANIGIDTTGNNAKVNIFDSTITTCTTGIAITGGARQSLLGCEIQGTLNGVTCSGASTTEITGCNFFSNPENAIDVAASGASAKITAESCNFYCSDYGTPRGTAFKVTNGAEIVATSHVIRNAVLGLECGSTDDTGTAVMKAGSIYLIDCTKDFQQTGTSMLRFLSGIFDAQKVTIENALNVSIASYDRPGEFGDSTMSVGNAKDVSQKIYEIFQDESDHYPHIAYEPNYYGTKGTVYKNEQGTPTFNGTQSLGNNAYSYVITSSRDKEAGIRLISDQASTIGSGDNVRGWAITKLANSADLAFSYTNNDSSGLAISGPNTIMQLDGNNNEIEFPLATNTPVGTTAKLIWGSDTNLYRASADTLKTDDSLVVEGNLSAGATTVTTLTIDAGSTTSPSLQFAGSTNTGFSAQTTNRLSFDTNGVERMSIDSTGTVSIPGTLVVAAGSAAQPSLKFTNGTNTGLSSATANKISFDSSGVEKMTIDGATVTATTTLVAAAACILQKQVCLGGLQVDASNNTSVTVADGTSILLKIPTANVASYAITMPSSPIHGQLLTIIVGHETFQINGITFPGATIVGDVTRLRPATAMTATTDGQCISLVYNAGTTTWYRYSRG